MASRVRVIGPSEGASVGGAWAFDGASSVTRIVASAATDMKLRVMKTLAQKRYPTPTTMFVKTMRSPPANTTSARTSGLT